MAMDGTKRVMSGTWGQLWLDGELVSECYGCKLVAKSNKEKVPRCGHMINGNKETSIDCTGSVKLYKTGSRMARKIGDAIKSGKDPHFTIIAKLDDPDSYGAERVTVSGVSFDGLTLADWEAGKIGTVEESFTYEDYDFLDLSPEV